MSDIWTSPHQRSAYLSVVAHYIDDDHKLNKRVIGLESIHESHIGEAITERILVVITEFKIENGIFLSLLIMPQLTRWPWRF